MFVEFAGIDARGRLQVVVGGEVLGGRERGGAWSVLPMFVLFRQLP